MQADIPTEPKPVEPGHIKRALVYRRDVVLVREGYNPNPDKSPRGEIKEFTLSARKRLAFVAANTDTQFVTMITLTYPKEYPSDGQVVKSHLNAFLTFLRRETHKCNYLWFLEFQRRGAPHVHILIDYPYVRSKEQMHTLRETVRLTWYRIVASGDEKHLLAGTRVEWLRSRDGGARYAVKYAMKMYQKVVPKGYRNVGRFWGCSRTVIPRVYADIVVSERGVWEGLQDWKYRPPRPDQLYRVCYGASVPLMVGVDDP